MHLSVAEGIAWAVPASEMTAHPVSAQVNSPRSQGEDLIKRVAINSA